MRTLEFSIKGLTEERLRRERDSRRGPAVITALLVASLIVLGKESLPGSGPESGPGPGPGSGPESGPGPGPGPRPRLGPTVRVSQKVVNFGEQKVGSLSALRNFSILSTSTQSFESRVSFSAAGATSFYYETVCAALELEQSCTVSVWFKPHTAGKQSANLTVQDDNGSVLANVDLIGIGISEESARISVDRPRVDFGSQEVGRTSEPERIQLINTSTTHFPASYVLSGDESTHFQASGCDGGHGSFFFGRECTLDVRFQPKSGGPHDAVVIIRETSDGGKPVNAMVLATIELHGEGLTAEVDISPRELNFREANGPKMDVTIRNTGGVPVSVYGARVTGPDAVRFQANVNQCRSQPIASNGQCVITVTHRISDSPRHAAELVIEHSAGDSAEINMYWEPAPAPRFVVDRQAIDFGVVDVGARNIESLTLTNIGNVEATNIGVVFLGGDASSFRVVESDCQGATIQPQGQCRIAVAFMPTKEDNLYSTLMVTTVNLRASVSVSVNGRGLRVAIE